MKAIGIKMVELQPMTAREANDKGYRIGNHSFEEDVENFITDVEVMTVGEKNYCC